MKIYEYQTEGTCSKLIKISIDEDDRISDLVVVGGCNGNLKGIASLVKGMKTEEVILRLKGINCGSRSTSCPDQLSKALTEIKEGKLQTI